MLKKVLANKKIFAIKWKWFAIKFISKLTVIDIDEDLKFIKIWIVSKLNINKSITITLINNVIDNNKI